ncbi:MAG: UDP-glucose 6-dehydrogenase [Devosia sp.]|jgi:UDPglucose 6-dehydrogenase|nr:UDP-glucose 6-dehydrogenase [Devosia sp.]
MRLIVVGSGYVGLVSGACLAQLGHSVCCVDSDARKIARLQAGDIPIFEPQLAELIARNVAAQRLSFVDRLPVIDEETDAVFIAVGTPPLPNGHGADLSHVFAAAGDIARKAASKILVVIKSTVPVGTGDAVERLIRQERPELAVSVASNPEFLREGSAIGDFTEPDRIIIGTDNPEARQTIRAIYADLAQWGSPVACMSRRAAELTKYAANAFLAVKIAFINEMADLCEAIGADVEQVALGMGLDRRIGAAFLQSGPGYGGSCFPKDSAALLATAQDSAVQLRLVESTIAANDARKRAIGRRVLSAMGGDLGSKTVAVLGLTFKPDTDDVRDAPALALVASLQRAGVTVRAYDPQGMDNARPLLPGVTLSPDAYSCAQGADCLVVATHWPEFATLDAALLARAMRVRLIVDLRNCLEPAHFTQAGFVLHGIGRTKRLPTTSPVAVVLRRRSTLGGAKPLNGTVPRPQLNQLTEATPD